MAFSAFTAGAQNNARYRETIIAYPDLTSKELPVVESAINNLAATTNLGYCSNHKCFMITYDPEVYTDGEAVAKTLLQLQPAYTPVVKSPVPFDQLRKDCY